jgi:hypothetical protein
MLTEILFYALILVCVFSYAYLIYFFIKEKVYEDLSVFDIVILLLGPIGLLFILIIGTINYDDDLN